jgi:hypothetical protein
MTDYPSTYVRPDASPYSGVIEYGLLRTTVDTVQAYQYKRNNSQNVKISLQFSMKNAAYVEWLDWVNTNAYNWFNMELVAPHFPTNEVLSTQRIRFIDDIRYTKRGHDYLSVSVTAEVYQGTDSAAPTRDDDWILAGTPAVPATDWIIGGTPAAPSQDWIVAHFYEV